MSFANGRGGCQLLNPIVSFFEEKNIRRVWTIIALYAVVIALFAWLIIWLMPILTQQFNELIEATPGLFDTIRNFANDVASRFSFNQEQQEVVNEGLGFFENIETNLMMFVTQGFSGVGNIILSITNTFVILLMVPIILFFLYKGRIKFSSRVYGEGTSW